MTVGLYGDAAPASAALFANLCTASLPGAPDLTYRNSQATRVERDKLIVLGRLSAGSAQAVSRRLDDTGYIRQELVDKVFSLKEARKTDQVGSSRTTMSLSRVRRAGRVPDSVPSVRLR